MIFKLLKNFLCRSGVAVLLEHPDIARKVCKAALKTPAGDSAVDKLERTAQALRLYFQGKIFTRDFICLLLFFFS